MYSDRFSLGVRLTYHAVNRMRERDISEGMVLDLIESGTVRKKDETHLWIYKAYPDRNDNMLCVAVVVESVLVVKTIMHYFVWEMTE